LEDLVARLDSESEWERTRAQEAIERRGKEGAAAVRAALEGKRLGARGRARGVWALARVEGAAAVERLFALAKSDADAGVQVQAIRALADLTDPVLVRHRLDAAPGDAALAERFAALAAGREARVRLEVTLALGRLRWRGAPAWLRKEIDPRDPALAHAALWSLRQAGDWPAVLKCLDEPDTDPFRAVARRPSRDGMTVRW
jgi:hypothetical protein